VTVAVRALARAGGTVHRLLAIALVARLPQGMGPLAVLLLVEARTGSLAGAAVASGAWGAGAAVGTVAWSRLADRRGALRALVAPQAVQLVALAGLLLLADGVVAAVALTLLAGLGVPPASSVVRAAWPRVLPDEAAVRGAYAVDASTQELIFILGPVLVTAVAVLDPGLALVLCGALGATGVALLVPNLPGPGPAVGREARSRASLLRPLAPTLALTGVLALGLGMIDVAAPVSAIVADERDLAGLLLAVWAVGSLVGGLALAGRLVRVAPLRRAGVLVAGAAVAAGLCAVAPSLPVLGATLALNGFFIAPSLAALYEQVALAAPVERRTEAFGLLVSVLLATAAAGTALAGVVSEALSPAAAFAGAAAILGAGALCGARARAA